jgi:hypothetical protein
MTDYVSTSPPLYLVPASTTKSCPTTTTAAATTSIGVPPSSLELPPPNQPYTLNTLAAIAMRLAYGNGGTSGNTTYPSRPMPSTTTTTCMDMPITASSTMMNMNGMMSSYTFQGVHHPLTPEGSPPSGLFRSLPSSPSTTWSM